MEELLWHLDLGSIRAILYVEKACLDACYSPALADVAYWPPVPMKNEVDHHHIITTALDHDVLPLDVTRCTQPVTEWGHHEGAITRRGIEQEAHAIHLAGLLRLGGEQHGEEAAGHGTEECSTLHYSIT